MNFDDVIPNYGSKNSSEYLPVQGVFNEIVIACNEPQLGPYIQTHGQISVTRMGKQNSAVNLKKKIQKFSSFIIYHFSKVQ